MEQSTSQALTIRQDPTGKQLGSYRVLEPLGSGGMSTVFRAVHAETGHEVALKVLLGAIAQNSTLLQRFLREARSAEALEHPNIVAIYDRGVDQGRHYLVLEFVAGGDFHDHVQRSGPLEAAEALTVVRGIASGLRYAATRGLIHRDIKPSNILRTPNGDPKIIDLGLALHSEFEDERVTREGTTVGTVDYMAPEQARDSRATSVQSDMYSLGCTFYYLLTGIPPYPGGDITEKLTRHARAPAPDIRDLRSEISDAVAAILLRLMAKQPEDRFPGYEELIGALDAAAAGESGASLEIALMPLDDEEPAGRASLRLEARSGGTNGAAPARRDWPDADEVALDSLDGLALELADERPSADSLAGRSEAERPLPRLGRAGSEGESEDLTESEHAEVLPVARPDRSLTPWILATSAVAVLAVVLVIGLHLILGGPRAAELSRESIPDPDRDTPPLAVVRTRPPAPAVAVGPQPRKDVRGTRPASPPPAQSLRPPEDEWHEPPDTDPIAGDPATTPALPDALRQHLPEWARAPAPPQPNAPLVVVRRVADVTAGPPTEPTLHDALDRYIGGTVEVADQGPLPVDDLRISGESRLVRARPSFRPTVWIRRSKPTAALKQEAFLALERKTLVLEGIDLIVDASDLSGRQRALFGCSSSNLTLRDCTVTVINRTGLPFTLIRQEPDSKHEPASRPSRIRLERTLVRGRLLTLAELGGGPADLVLDGTSIITDGAGSPVVRVLRTDTAAERRAYFVGTLIACPGPIIRRDPAASGAQTGRLAIRTYGSAFGRIQGEGIASIVTSPDERAVAERAIDWAGDSNVFACWRGFFAHGKDYPTVTVDSLAKARSTWNATEQGSQEIPPGWTLEGEPARESPGKLMTRFLTGRASQLTRPAGPSPGLFLKTIDLYPDPLIPEPAAWALARPNGAVAMVGKPGKVLVYDPRQNGSATIGTSGPGNAPGASPLASVRPDLEMNTADLRWNGDLGAFLRGQALGSSQHVKVRVLGTGSHRFTPATLPHGLTLEIQVVPYPPGAELPSWSPDPQATVSALIELRGGALVLSQLNLRHDPASRLESLLALDDSHLILDRCQLTVPPDSGAATGDLIRFRAVRPMSSHSGNDLFAGPVDRPVCRLIDTILIANGAALRANIGRGLVALTGCAVAGDETALALEPADVARRSFAADLWLDRCTLVSGRSIIRLGPWSGLPPGPDRPWLISSRQSAFFARTDAKTREATLLRVDADAFAGGCLFWSADGDAYDLDDVIAGQETAVVPANPRETVVHRWDRFWGSNRVGRALSGPHRPGTRLREWPRPGQIEPSDLILEQVAQPQRAQPDVGAELPRLGISPRPLRPGPRRN
jgi:serine/threonine-protein kinase